jgi:SnoaL-like domain
MDRADAVADKQEITEVMTRYCYAVDFRDLAQLRGVFTPDAEATYVLTPVGMDDVHLSGVDEIIEWLASVLPNLGEPAPRHAMTNFLVELDGDRARSRNYMGAGAGLYTVEHVRTSDGWRARRFEMRNFGTSAAG